MSLAYLQRIENQCYNNFNIPMFSALPPDLNSTTPFKNKVVCYGRRGIHFWMPGTVIKLHDNIAGTWCLDVYMCMRVVRFVIDKPRSEIGSQSAQLVVIEVYHRMLKFVRLIS